MKNTKISIALALLFLSIGIATVTTNLIIEGKTPISSNTDDFFVYFSKAENASVTNSKTIAFNMDLKTTAEIELVKFEITNASKYYDAELIVECNDESEYYKIHPMLYKNTISARETTYGELQINLIKHFAGTETNYLIEEVTCTINATAKERTTEILNDVPEPLKGYPIGQEITIGAEKFNIISDNGDTISLLAQKGLNSSYRQASYANSINIISNDDWEYTPGPKEIDLETYAPTAVTYLNEYKNYLKTLTGSSDITSDLITVKELINLGCDATEDYSESTGCQNSPYKEWLIINDYWWTKSAYSGLAECIYIVKDTAFISWQDHTDRITTTAVIRPVITIPKSIINDDSTATLISFTIEGETYQAEAGMTWLEWVNSEYDLNKFEVYHDSYYYDVYGQESISLIEEDVELRKLIFACQSDACLIQPQLIIEANYSYSLY